MKKKRWRIIYERTHFRVLRHRDRYKIQTAIDDQTDDLTLSELAELGVTARMAFLKECRRNADDGKTTEAVGEEGETTAD